MGRRWKDCIRDWIPPRLLRAVRDRRNNGRIRYGGHYQSWEEARRASGGYDSPFILEKVKSSLEKVRDGLAAGERDSVLLDRAQPSFPLLAGLFRAAAASCSRLNVLDVGGSLGSSYFQCRDFLDPLQAVDWNVVEQPTFVECGRTHFQTDRLRFYADIAGCLAEQDVNLILLSSVLPYVPDPHVLLDELVGCEIPHVIVDRTPLLDAPPDRLTVQTVPASIYGRETSYPAWILSRETLVRHFQGRYNLIVEFGALSGTIDLGDAWAADSGFIFEIRRDDRT